MKKILALVLSMIMLLPVFAFAEDVSDKKEIVIPAFEITTITPEGYTATEPVWFTPYVGSLLLEPMSADKPYITTVISYNDSASDITFNDEFPEDQFADYVKMIMINAETGEEIPYSVQKTGLGTNVVIATHENSTELYTIWHGYEVSVYAYVRSSDGVYSPVSDEQLAIIMKYLTDLDISKIIEE